jgi:hypothetical protein
MFDKMKDSIPIKYFDKRVPEEDCPINLLDTISTKYEVQDMIYEELFDENSQHMAKVKII